MSFLIIADPLVTTTGSVRPAILLSRELKKLNFEITIVSATTKESINSMLSDFGINIIDLKQRPLLIKHMPTLEYWCKQVLFRKDNDLNYQGNDCVIINMSSTIMTKTMHIYYAQGPMVKAIRTIRPDMPWYYKVLSTISLPILEPLERTFIKKIRERSSLFIANSRACKRFYEALGVSVDRVIYPPLDTELYKPSTPNPSANYVLTYFGTYGKETRYKVLKQIADRGVKIKAFGNKPHYIPRYILQHPNIEFRGYVDDNELVELYSNALYTLFAFNHEPFGYIPVESMACGTPVLTYNKEGPSESVLNDTTGWLVNTDEELVDLAVKIWRDGYPSRMRTKCRERALEFDVKIIAEEWIKTIKSVIPDIMGKNYR